MVRSQPCGRLGQVAGEGTAGVHLLGGSQEGVSEEQRGGEEG